MYTPFVVALHPEGVDRNSRDVAEIVLVCVVALHPEGVDRNEDCARRVTMPSGSPSTRRAWIEISRPDPVD